MSPFVAGAQRFLACLSDPSRFRLVMRLAESERCVTELAADVGLSQSCTTRHLQALEREGIVRGVRRGKRVVFGLDPSGGGLHPVVRWAMNFQSAPPERTRREPASSVPAPPEPEAPLEHESGWVSDQPGEAAGHTRAEATLPSPRDLEDFLL